MKGLSLTAIGMRPLAECLVIADRLKEPLELEFVELAIGVDCSVDSDYLDWPLLLHDSCLRDGGGRLRLDPLIPASWNVYQRFCEQQNVVGIGVHAPAKRRCTGPELIDGIAAMEDHFQVPVAIEVMPEQHRWCSSLEALVDVPLLLDVSHVLIWERGDQAATEATCGRILDGFDVSEIHLSHNDGRRDSHELIPSDNWFDSYVAEWSATHFVTYESLPENLHQYERCDKKRRRPVAKN